MTYLSTRRVSLKHRPTVVYCNDIRRLARGLVYGVATG